MIVLLAMAAAVIVGRGASDRPTATEPRSHPLSPAPSPSELVPFRDEAFRIGLPRGWRRIESPDPQVAVVAAGDRGGSMLVRVTEPGFAVDDEDQLADAQRFTDQIVTGGQDVELLAQPARIELDGLPGWYYFYTFEDGPSGRQGVHAHYFLFEGPTMFSLVFQTLPADRFVELAPTFDAVAASFAVTGGASPG